MSKCPFSNERNCGFCGESVPDNLIFCPCGHQRAVQKVEELTQQNEKLSSQREEYFMQLIENAFPESERLKSFEKTYKDICMECGQNKKLNDFSQGLVAINLSLNDQVSQLREELAQYKTEIEQLREIAENERLKANEENHIRFQRELQAKCVATQEVVDSLRAEIKELRENQISISHMQRSNAWGEVHSVLTEVAPDWNKGKDSGTNLACATIRKLADDAKKFRSLELANVVTTSFEDQKLKVTLAFETIPREVNIYTEIVKP